MDFQNAADFGKITKAIEKLNNKNNTAQDDRFWQPSVGKDGSGYAVIRFLPTPQVDGAQGLPWVQIYSHGFQGPTGRWYIENSLTTIGKQDPIAEMNSRLWKEGTEEAKEIVRKRKRRLHYISNIVVVEDPANPENNGKVFLYRYGKKIFDKVNEAMHPAFQDEKPMNPFDMVEGANFKIKIRNVEGYRNYDKSEFAEPSRLGTDEFLDKLWKSEYSLLDFVSDDKFKSYDELKTQLEMVLGEASDNDIQTYVPKAMSAKEIVDDEIPFLATSKKQEPVEDEDKKTLDYFKSLAAE